jgi:hypothetical protein
MSAGDKHGHTYDLADVHRVVEARGWFDIHEEPPPGLEEITTIYTVGFALIDEPEIICVGLSHNVVTQLVVAIWHRTVNHNFKIVPGQVYRDLANLPMRFDVVADEWREAICTITTAYYRRFYEEQQFSAVQLVWSDKRGRFPDNPQFDHSMRRAARLLGGSTVKTA